MDSAARVPYTQKEMARLRSYVCYLCDLRLDREVCPAIWGQCSPEFMGQRRRDCLDNNVATRSRVLANAPEPSP